MKILIVEDIADDRRLLRYNLEHHGCEVIEAADGQEGLEMAKAHKPDMIISDALMPKMDGFQFLRAVKTDDSLKEIPFVFYSAIYTGYKEAELAISLGAEEFIIKPKEPEEFWEELQVILENCRLKTSKKLTAEPIEEEEEFLQKYSHIIAVKLEEKVNELEATRKKLASTRERLDHILSYSPACIFSTETAPPFNTTFISSNVTQMLGYEVREFQEDPNFWFDRVHPDDLKMILSDFPQIEDRGGAAHVFRFRHKNGTFRWMLAEVRLTRDELGKPVELIGFWTDITERKMIETALMQSEERFKNIFDTILDGIYQTDADNRFSLINNSGAKIFGYDSPDEMIGRPVVDYWADPAERKKFIENLKLHNSLSAYQLDAKKKDGSIIHLEITSNLLRNKDGKPIGTEGIIRDVTERKKLENQFRQAQKMEAVGQLAGGIAHDFNNFLTAIIGYGNILQMKMKGENLLRSYVDVMLSSAEKAADLTKSLLSFSRKQVINLKPVNLNELIEKLGKLLIRLIREDIPLKLSLSGKPLTVMADSGQIEQVLMNLATNARDAMPDGGVLSIETREAELDEEFIQAHGYGEPGHYAVISVTDTGTGMDKNTRERIFEPFFTTKETGKGTGLGLAMVYGLIKQHNGYINVYSEPGKGTAFHLYLPLIKADAEAIGREAAAEISFASGTEHVLVADDNEEVRALVKVLLEDAGYKVLTASDGEEAVNIFMQHKDRLDLVILDVIMPKKNGREAYQEIAGIRPGIKAIFMSGYTADVIHQKGVLDEKLEYIPKPISPNELLKKVREMLDR